MKADIESAKMLEKQPGDVIIEPIEIKIETIKCCQLLSTFSMQKWWSMHILTVSTHRSSKRPQL